MLVDPAAEQAGVDLDQRRRRQAGGAELVDEALGEPQPQVHRTAPPVAPGSDAAEHDPGGRGAEQHPAGRADEQQPAEQHPAPAHVGEPVEAEDPAAHEGAEADPGEPAQRADRAQAHGRDHLGGLGLQGHREHRRVLPAGGGGHVVEGGPQLGQPGVVVDVGDGDLGEALAQPADELGRGEAAAAEVEEVVVGPGRRAAEDGGPVARDPGRGALDARRLLGCRGARAGGRRPGQGVAVDLAGGAGGQGVDHRQPRHERGRHRPAQPLDRGLGVEAGLGGDVARPAGCCRPRCDAPRPRHRSPRGARGGRCRPRRARCAGPRP